MTFPVYRHFEFTRDTAYLKSIYPILKGSAEFVIDFLIESPEGYLVTNPSHSPENSFFVPGTNQKERSSLTYSATIDIQIIKKLFDFIISSSEILDRDQVFAEKIKEARKNLPPIQIGENSTIQEWIQDYEEVEIGHRHMSHLLGLYPLAQITPETPQLFEAAQKTIQRRLSSGGGHTG
jgi:alpha-L-fucosidase 2